MIQFFVDKTKTKTQNVKTNLPAYCNNSDKNTFIGSVDQREFSAFTSLLYARGLLGQSVHTYKMLF